MLAARHRLVREGFLSKFSGSFDEVRQRVEERQRAALATPAAAPSAPPSPIVDPAIARFFTPGEIEALSSPPMLAADAPSQPIDPPAPASPPATTGDTRQKRRLRQQRTNTVLTGKEPKESR